MSDPTEGDSAMVEDRDEPLDDAASWEGDRPPLPAPPLVAPEVAYIHALTNYDGALLVEIARRIGIHEPPLGRPALAAAIAERVGQTRLMESSVDALPPDARLALTLFALTETTSIKVQALSHALKCLGADPALAVRSLLKSGLAATEAPDVAYLSEIELRFLQKDPEAGRLWVHPAVVTSARTVLPTGGALPEVASVRQVRESDGLEPLLRIAALWQRVADSPIRQTQQGQIYKRDRERIEDDPVLAGPIADALEPLPDMPGLWLALARGVGLIEPERDSERVVAAPPEFWSDNAYHLAHMAAVRWLSLTNWHEQGGLQREGATEELALPHTRAPILLWLATLSPDAWVAIDDLADHLRARNPEWEAPSFLVQGDATPTSARNTRRPRTSQKATPETGGGSTLEALLLGPAYQLGLVRAAAEVPSDRRVVQLTPLGRYLLALGPAPTARPAFDQFLFVQPSFEIIAYRQGLTASLIGQFSRFTHWMQLGAALALKLAPESVYRGLEGGMTPAAMLDLLTRCSSRPLSTSVAESIRTWASRRERVTYHASATLMEFASPEDLELALARWPGERANSPVRVSDRLLLVEGNEAIPFPSFRMTGARDYRRPPEACVQVEADGVTLLLDMARSDLLVDAEIARFADETAPPPRAGSSVASPRRRFVVTPASIARGCEAGLTATSFAQWFARRTGHPTPPALRLLIAAQTARLDPLETSRPLVLHTPSADLLDGLAQHPETRKLLGDRLGPTSVVVPEGSLPAFKAALQHLGLDLLDPPENRPT